MITTGKTLFQYYLLIRLLQQKQVVLFSMNGTELFLFYFGEVWTAMAHPDLDLPKSQRMPSHVFIWSLFEAEMEPNERLFCYFCFPVQTTSQDTSCKQWCKQRNPYITGFPLWTREELIQG